MAKGKTVAAVWMCEETGAINGVVRVMKDKVKDMKRNKYSPRLRKVTSHKLKLVKKGS
jgi:hypothetical protein